MSSKRKEYKVDDRAKKAALLFLACEANPDTRLSIPAAMRAKGYLDVQAAGRGSNPCPAGVPRVPKK
jgi:hypothetical protein